MLVRRLFALGLFLALVWSPVLCLTGAEDPPKNPAAPPAAATPAPAANPAPAATPAAPAATPATEPAAAEAIPTDGKDRPLTETQDIINRRYKRFEDTLYKIAESLRKTDPDRAELLIRAIGKSKEERIAPQLADLVQLLKDQRLGDALEKQGDVVVQMRELLDLLLSEDRQKELKEEQARIKKYIEEVNKIIAKEKGNRADNERGMPADDVAGQQKKIADQTGDLNKQIAKDDAAKAAKSQANSKGKAGDKEGKPSDKEGKPGEGKPGDKEGKPEDKEGKPGDKEGKPEDKEGKPGDKEGKPEDKEGKPGEGKPGDKEGKPSEGKPSEGKPSEGKPSEGKPSEGKPSEGQPSEGQEGEAGKQPPQQQTPGREDLEEARRAMERAMENLKKNKRQNASDDQDDAIAALQKAKEKFEEILRQLREEEKKKFLAMLEARFRRMLEMQLLVYDGTLKLAKTPEADRVSRHSAKSIQLARQEEEIAIEATKAITILREEGTAVAFPEAVEQMRDDMRFVVTKLERTDVGELTQGVEKDIIEALEEMIDALQKEMEKMKDKDQQQQQQQGQQQDPALVDQLAELKMLRTLQLRINRRTKLLGRLTDGEQATKEDVVQQLQDLGDRQARVQKATYDIATGRNK